MNDTKEGDDKEDKILGKALVDSGDHGAHQMAEPPPSYPQAQGQALVEVHPPEDPTASAYPPQPHHTQAPFRTLHIMYESWRLDGIRILETDRSTLLYTLKRHLRTPHLTLESASSAATVATAILHFRTSRVDITVNEAAISMTSRGFWQDSYKWSSPALKGATVTWRCSNSNLDLVCVDEQEIAIARFRYSSWSLKKCGSFEILGPNAGTTQLTEEMLVTGLALLVLYQRL